MHKAHTKHTYRHTSTQIQNTNTNTKDERYPLGYKWYEPMVNGLKAMLVLGVSVLAFFGAGAALISGGNTIITGVAIGCVCTLTHTNTHHTHTHARLLHIHTQYAHTHTHAHRLSMRTHIHTHTGMAPSPQLPASPDKGCNHTCQREALWERAGPSRCCKLDG